MIKKRMRHINRYREIVTALVKFGFGYIVKEIGLFHLISNPIKKIRVSLESEHVSVGKRLRLFMEELGPTFVKLGQLLSIRGDLIPKQLTIELGKLQDDVKPVDPLVIEHIIESELGAPTSELFSSFSGKSLAAASIGQVHKATLKTGETVAVKIRRPHVEKQIETDIEILRDLTRLVEQRFAWAKQYQLRDIVDELSEAIKSEMDYSQEGRNAEKVARQFTDDDTIIIPRVYWDFSTKKILTMEFIEGKKYTDITDLPEDTFNKELLAERLVNSFLKQVLVTGIYHGDPHPGNLFFLPGNKIAYIDFGQVGILSQEMKNNFSSLIIGLMRKNTDILLHTVLNMAIVPEEIDEGKLRNDLDQLRDKYYDIPFSKINIAEAISDLFEVTQKHQITIPKDYTLLGKALITLEGIVTSLDERLSIIDLAEPFGKKLLLERAHPKNVLSKLWDNVQDISGDTLKLPRLLKKVLIKVDRGDVHLEMELPQIDKLLLRIDRIGNRISFSVTLLACSIIIMGLIIAKTFGNHFLDFFPIVDIGIVIVILMFLWLIFSIFRSGRL
ncbi:ubiquinone biosynthesis protein [Pullulanibacillus pueri]|uniref:ABC transporter n=1 Tax=Pullulanibacillus pueri TaxID=1437324 RepID=A0A8J2ZTE8_9BACL|nr:AarF/ABC1/UbiB kinase family protein [Pullulanibacillus pueri]MBM7681355.1 ubiquinone biosynthesis protein [Pullulanibacillus pueri]GGH77475.1 ABC transporter [Pullulanibacillus pueri]